MTPFFLQPYNPLRYLRTKKQVWPQGIDREVYLSFEDALWDLLPRLGYRKGSLILVPSFYCVDVIENMKSHGYRVEIYNVERNFSINYTEIAAQIEKLQPDIIIDFHPEGMPSLFSGYIERKLPLRTLLVTDMVHRIPEPNHEFFPINERHVIINSYRKTTPFTGAVAIYTRNARTSANKYPWGYMVKAVLLWQWYVLLLGCAKLFHSRRIALHAEKVLRTHNDLIGDSPIGSKLPKFLFHLFDRIDTQKIADSKIKQSLLYFKELQPISENYNFFTIPIEDLTLHDDEECTNEYEYGHLRGFPMVFDIDKASKFIEECRKQGFFATSQLDDCDWSKKQKLVLLPLGPELSLRHQQKLIKIVINALTLSN